MSTKNSQKSGVGKNENIQKKSYSNISSLVKRELLGIGITNATTNQVLEYVQNFLENSSKNCYIVTPNPEMVVLSTKNADFKSALNGAELALNDGVGLSLASKFLGRPLKERITGVDFVKKVCAMSNDWPITVGFLGGGPKIAERAAECLQQEFPRLKVAFAQEEFLCPKLYTLNPPIDVLFVAYGAPKQEFFMRDNLNKIPARIMVGVGGSFDYISGNVKRAPRWIQKIGFEWFYRLIHQPWRWRRQRALLEFVWLVVKEKFSMVS